MSELQEKREYYPDRSVQSVYFVDEQGRKQGEAKKYQKNNSEPEYVETYVDNKRTMIAYANGEYETFDENGNTLRKKCVKTSLYGLIKGEAEKGRNTIIDMSYKNGKEWIGTKEIIRLGGPMLWPVSHEKFEILEGTMHKYEFNDIYGKKSETAHFDNGVLDGLYSSDRFPPKFLNLKKMGVNLGKIH